MKSNIPLIRPLVLTLLVLASFVTTTLAQEVQIPDPGLNAAIREALEQPNGPLTEQDLLSLINLDASSRDVSSVEGLEAARNLERLFLDSNRLTHFSLPGALTDNLSPQKFYRALLQGPPMNMVFIPPNTFTMGSPTTEQDRSVNERPQTTVTWGLYDMEGNVVEWCQDWFGSLPGGVQTDPTGPASSASGRKVVRGGAYDNTEQSSRSAARFLFPVSSFITDADLGFRVVLVTGPQ